MSSPHSPIIRGYLLLADISGYTSFLSQTELDHAHEILSDLLETILQRFQALLTIHKIEGDAIFAYGTDARLIRGETVLELLETTYTDFRERMRNVRRHTTCTCRACQSIPMLDLKFIVHHGDFIVQDIGGTPELAGSDVNLAHRLLKNHVAERTGWRAYALFTSAALDRMGIRPEGLVEGTESYEHLGEVTVAVMDMHPRYEQLLQTRRVVVADEEAMLTFAEDLPSSPPLVWSWLNEPEKRQLVSLDPHGLEFVPILRPGGRTGPGATTHCVHGKSIAMREKVLDWKPFDYFTVEQDSGPMGIIQVTFHLEPTNGGQHTHLQAVLKGSVGHVPGFLNRQLIRFLYTRVFNYQSVASKLKELLTEAAIEPANETDRVRQDLS
ncbi:MAG TPA: DUF2652 domain-containing protein [Anaerolineales bacterium]|nr:DUF2652 domain-containing protein [Anaerolineales bacterium]